MRVAIIGTHSTGKTTLAKAIAEAFPIPYVRGDKALDLASQLFPGRKLDELEYDEHWLFQQHMLKSLVESARPEGDFVSDGCPLTCIPYSLIFCGEAVAQEPDYQALVDESHRWTKSFTHLIYLPPEIGLEKDSFRPESEYFRLAVDKVLREILREYAYYKVRGTVAERVSEVGKILGLRRV